ncbi:MAG: hypothetical protein VW935_15295, partial [Novosphingobium sp.]
MRKLFEDSAAAPLQILPDIISLSHRCALAARLPHARKGLYENSMMILNKRSSGTSTSEDGAETKKGDGAIARAVPLEVKELWSSE